MATVRNPYSGIVKIYVYSVLKTKLFLLVNQSKVEHQRYNEIWCYRFRHEYLGSVLGACMLLKIYRTIK